MKIEVKCLSDEIEEFLKRNAKKDYELFRYWPVIAGPSLSAVTELYRFKDGILYIKTNSSSAKGLLMLEKNRIVKTYQEKFPNFEIKSLALTKRT